MATTAVFAFAPTGDGAYQVRAAGDLLGTVRKGSLGGWYATPDGDPDRSPAGRPTRQRAAELLVGIRANRAAHEADNRPAPIPDGFEAADVTDLKPGDVVRHVRTLTPDGNVRAWAAAERTVRLVEVYAHGHGGYVWFVPRGPGETDHGLISNYGARKYARRITTEGA